MISLVFGSWKFVPLFGLDLLLWEISLQNRSLLLMINIILLSFIFFILFFFTFCFVIPKSLKNFFCSLKTSMDRCSPPLLFPKRLGQTPKIPQLGLQKLLLDPNLARLFVFPYLAFSDSLGHFDGPWIWQF